ncbi:MAG: hypothetical protein ABII71_02550 [Candidatus Micrarchaeota archaeon]
MMGLLFSAYSFYGDWDAVWMPLSMLAVVTVITIHILVRMLAKAFSMREMERYADSEIMQAGATALMAIFLVIMINSALELSQDMISGELQCGDDNIRIAMDDSESAMSEALDGIRCRIQEKALEVSKVHEAVFAEKDGWTDFHTQSIMLGIFGITIYKGDWDGDLFSYTETLRITNNLATVILIALNAQAFLILYIKHNMLTVFLPVGILLRSFHVTRGAGALFIATAIGFYFVFPIMFLLLDPGFVHIPLEPPPPSPAGTKFCYPTMASTATIVSSLEVAGFGSTNLLTMDTVRDVLTESYVSLMLHPLIALFVTLMFIRYLMTLLQGDTFELMKMVSKVI